MDDNVRSREKENSATLYAWSGLNNAEFDPYYKMWDYARGLLQLRSFSYSNKQHIQRCVAYPSLFTAQAGFDNLGGGI